MAVEADVEEVFNPAIHLEHLPPASTYTFEDLKLNQPVGATRIAASDPFPLLSIKGIRAYRKAISASEVLNHCAFTPFKNTLVLRDVARYSSFVRELWDHPTTKGIIANIAGVSLTPVIPTEIGHINIQTKSTRLDEMVQELSPEPSGTSYELTEEQKSSDPLASPSIQPWHYDSFPYVCVLMLSNTNGMHGGETYLKTGDGSALKVNCPSIGHCVFLHGGEVQHLAAKAIGVDERITSITSLRAEAPGIYDSSYLTNVRPVTNLPILYKEWTEYRLRKMKTEIAVLEAQLAQSSQTGSSVDIEAIQRFADAQIEYLRRTADQLVPQELHERILNTYGKDAYYSVDEYWSRIRTHSEFDRLVHEVDTRFFQRGPSRIWNDYQASRASVARGETLCGQAGTLSLLQHDHYTFGDELLRQGLREYFFEWLEATGLIKLILEPSV